MRFYVYRVLMVTGAVLLASFGLLQLAVPLKHKRVGGNSVGCPQDYFTNGRAVDDDDFAFNPAADPLCTIRDYSPFPVPEYPYSQAFNLTSPEGVLAMCVLACINMVQLNMAALMDLPGLTYAEDVRRCKGEKILCYTDPGLVLITLFSMFGGAAFLGGGDDAIFWW